MKPKHDLMKAARIQQLRASVVEHRRTAQAYRRANLRQLKTLQAIRKALKAAGFEHNGSLLEELVRKALDAPKNGDKKHVRTAITLGEHHSAMGTAHTYRGESDDAYFHGYPLAVLFPNHKLGTGARFEVSVRVTSKGRVKPNPFK